MHYLKELWHALVGTVGDVLDHVGLGCLNQYDWRGRPLRRQTVDECRVVPSDHRHPEAVVKGPYLTHCTVCVFDDFPEVRR
jgi:hypothetical protein